MHFSKAKIMALKSTVHNESRTPPSILPLTEGGGLSWEVTFAQIWTVQKGARPSTVYNESQTPPLLSAFNGGGGVRVGG